EYKKEQSWIDMISWDKKAVSAYWEAETFKKEYRQLQAESKETEAATEEGDDVAMTSDG
ncbi:hypothetical protein PSV08DRAFT_268075, partial [Bipolaris maydis]|uniref:uncharacterized protein n=1 Tax=Cochliobolus heterostrophus TaxID=5016 RepID=UPI0024D1BE06